MLYRTFVIKEHSRNDNDRVACPSVLYSFNLLSAYLLGMPIGRIVPRFKDHLCHPSHKPNN